MFLATLKLVAVGTFAFSQDCHNWLDERIYVLEGFLQAAMSDDSTGKAFREQYVLYAVPFVDKDGVEEGDQGKNHKPHDHNRDYGEVSIYSEVQAIKELDQAKDFQFSLDFHCPTLVMILSPYMRARWRTTNGSGP